LSVFSFIIFAFTIFFCSVFVSCKKIRIFLYAILFFCMSVSFDTQNYYDLQNYQNSIEGFLRQDFEIGWEFFTSILYQLLRESKYVIIAVYCLNGILLLFVFWFLNSNFIYKGVFEFIFLSKWVLYQFIVIRLGLASLLFFLFFISFYLEKKITIINFLLLCSACIVHYSLIIFSILFIPLFLQKRRLVLIIYSAFLVLILLFIPYVIQFDSRVDRYLFLDYSSLRYSILHILAMLSFIFFTLLFLPSQIQSIKYILASLLFLGIIFQPFDTINRLFFLGVFICLYIIFLEVQVSFIYRLFLFFLGIVFLLRYSLFSDSSASIIQ
jgi:hypothetical protein